MQVRDGGRLGSDREDTRRCSPGIVGGPYGARRVRLPTADESASARELDMPLNLAPQVVSTDLENVDSVLFVSCPVCPPVSLAMAQGSPLFDFFRSGLKTPAFEAYIEELREPLEQRGVRTGVFSVYRPLPMMCLWTGGQRKRLLERARGYEVVVVLGCDSAAYTTRRALEETDCRVVQGMRIVGITNARVEFHGPGTVVLADKARVQGIQQAGAGASRAPPTRGDTP